MSRMSIVQALARTIVLNTKLHLQHIKMHISNRMAYRGDFFASFFAFFLWQLVAPVFVLAAYYNGASFPGWSIPQVIVLQGVVSFVTGIASVFLMGIYWNTRYLVRQGNFDFIFIRPINSLWLLIMMSFDAEDLGQIFGSLILLSIGLFYVGGVKGSIILFLLFCIVGILFMFTLALFISAITIKVVQTQRAQELLMTMGVIAKYPRTLYAKEFTMVFTVAIPLFTISHYPAAALLGMDLSGLYLSCMSVVVLFCISLWVWFRTLKSYSSAGG